MEKKLWYAAFSRDENRGFLCPQCRTKLELDKTTLKVEATTYSQLERKSDEWDPEWSVERFIVFLRCPEKTCGEIVAVSGHISVEPAYQDNGDWQYEGMLAPKSMYPAPHIISLPKNIPGPVLKELELAFQLFWSDYNACATKIRTSLERLMDHFKVVKMYLYKDAKKPTKPGKYRPFDLSIRIDKFISASGDALHKDHLHALRVVGNVGTHKSSLSRTEILDAFEVYEHLLSELVGKKSAQIAKIAKKLRDNTGKRKKGAFDF